MAGSSATSYFEFGQYKPLRLQKLRSLTCLDSGFCILAVICKTLLLEWRETAIARNTSTCHANDAQNLSHVKRHHIDVTFLTTKNWHCPPPPRVDRLHRDIHWHLTRVYPPAVGVLRRDGWVIRSKDMFASPTVYAVRAKQTVGLCCGTILERKCNLAAGIVFLDTVEPLAKRNTVFRQQGQ